MRLLTRPAMCACSWFVIGVVGAVVGYVKGLEIPVSFGGGAVSRLDIC